MINRMQQYRKKTSLKSPPPDSEDEESGLSESLGLSQLKELVRTHPIAAISMGLVAGLTLGWWVKRK